MKDGKGKGPSLHQPGRENTRKTQPKAGLARPPTPPSASSRHPPCLYPHLPLAWPPPPTPCIPPVCSLETPDSPRGLLLQKHLSAGALGCSWRENPITA